MWSCAERYSGVCVDRRRRNAPSQAVAARHRSRSCSAPKPTCARSKSAWQTGHRQQRLHVRPRGERRRASSHRYRAVDVPDLDDKWALMIGDCVHNLRSALDYLAHELVRANGGTPDDHTQFPVHAAPGGVRVHGGIADDALAAHRGGAALRRERRRQPHPTRSICSTVPTASGRSCSRPRQPGTTCLRCFGAIEPGAADRRSVDEHAAARSRRKTVHGYTYRSPFFGEDPQHQGARRISSSTTRPWRSNSGESRRRCFSATG